MRVVDAVRRLPVGVGVALLVLGALLLRLPTAGDQSYWLDEIYSIRILDGSFGHAWSTVQQTENTPPLYYLVAWVWTQLFGTGELGVRSLSAIAGALAVVPAVWLARTVGARAIPAWVPLVAGLLIAVNPFAQWFSQEARSYGLFLLLAGLAWAALFAALSRPTPARLWAWSAAAVLAGWTHYFGILLLLVGWAALLGAEWWTRRGGSAAEAGMAAEVGRQGADVEVEQAVRIQPQPRRALREHRGVEVPDPDDSTSTRAAVRRLGPPLLASLVGVAALVPIALKQHSTSMYEAIAGVKGLGSRIVETPKQFAVGYNAPAEIVLGAAIAVVLLVLVVAGAWPRRGRVTRATVLAGIAAVVWVVPLLGVAAGFDVVLTRNYIVLLPPVAVLAALGAWRLGRPGVIAALAVAVAQLALVIVVMVTPAYQRDDWRGVMRATEGLPGPTLLVFSRFQPFPVEYYEPTVQQLNPYTVVGVRSFVLIDRPSEAGEQAPPPIVPPGLPVKGMRVVRQVRTDQYRLIAWTSDQPIDMNGVILNDLAPGSGPRMPALLP